MATLTHDEFRVSGLDSFLSWKTRSNQQDFDPALLFTDVGLIHALDNAMN